MGIDCVQSRGRRMFRARTLVAAVEPVRCGAAGAALGWAGGEVLRGFESGYEDVQFKGVQLRGFCSRGERPIEMDGVR